MKRIFLFAVILISAVTVKAQMPLSFGAQPGYRHFSHGADSSNSNRKWFLTKYASISTGFMVFKGGSGSFVSAPVGVQLNRQLTNNVYAFANVSVAPTYFNFNSSFYQPGIGKVGFMNPNKFEINPAAQIGLMYVNPDRTFSISGSVGVSRNSYNYYGAYPFYNPANTPQLRNYK